MSEESKSIPKRGTWEAAEYCLTQAKSRTEGEARAYLEVLGHNLDTLRQRMKESTDGK